MNDDELRREYQRSTNTMPLGPHPEPEQLAKLVSGEMPEAERLTLLEHVLRCKTCKPELELLRAANEGARAVERRSFPTYWMALAAAALILVGIGVLTIRTHRIAVAVDGAQSYRVEVLTTRGDVIAAWSTPDTSLSVPDSVRINASESYDMWVRAMLPDRTEVSSPVVRFSVKR